MAAMHGGALGQLVDAHPAFSDLMLEPTQLSEQVLRPGKYTNVSDIHLLQRGQTAADVRQLLGEPSARTQNRRGPAWEYHVSLPIAGETGSLVCQLMVVFGADARVDEIVWRRPQCEALAGSTIDMAADFLFAFDEYRLSPAGQGHLDLILERWRQQNGRGFMTIVGHTDRIGSADYNQRLSEQRAHTVAQYLVQRGVPAQAIRAIGIGESEPIVTCAETKGIAALKECLAPNRRVSINIKAA